MVLSSSREGRRQGLSTGNIGGAAGGISDAVQGEAVPLHRNGHPSTGQTGGPQRPECGEFRCSSWRYAPLLVKVCFLPQRIPSGARACMAMPQNKKAARRRQGRIA